jgi:hypothetical protein
MYYLFICLHCLFLIAVSLEITWCIYLVVLGWICKHLDNCSRQDTSLGNFTCQALRGLLMRFGTSGTMPTGLRENEQGALHESAHSARRLAPRLDKLCNFCCAIVKISIDCWQINDENRHFHPWNQTFTQMKTTILYLNRSIHVGQKSLLSIKSNTFIIHYIKHFLSYITW